MITGTTTGRARVRLNGCPSCRRPLVLDHCGVAGDIPEDGMQYVDLELVTFAQQLHMANCRG